MEWVLNSSKTNSCGRVGPRSSGRWWIQIWNISSDFKLSQAALISVI